jgi:hypothetical protein
MTLERLVATDLPGSRDTKPLVGAPVRPDLWHSEPFLRFLQTFERFISWMIFEAKTARGSFEGYGIVSV